ncbi:hypothetical protein A2U01_0021015 [Trifolium medium]|uniref:Uncharacterized protein n=1 Tax=Trifolium medium TaxID=97028 RepID=A0A392NJJ5_9FABA|nr:hypothetical protein [Trifolium medium]
MSHSNLDLYLKLIWTWASEHFLHVPPLSPWSFVSNAWILTPGRNILPLIYHCESSTSLISSDKLEFCYEQAAPLILHNQNRRSQR